jgi:hypothetical protein
MILDTTMSLRTSRLQWQSDIYVTRVTHCTIIHKFDKVWSLCTATPPCNIERSKYCAKCNRWFLSEKCLQNHLTHKVKGKLVCQWGQVFRNCSFTVTCDSKHEYFKRFFNNCNKMQHSGHYCYVAPLKPSKPTDRFMYVFFHTECTQDFEKHDGSFEHIPNLICAQQMCSKYEVVGWLECWL